MRVLWLLLAPLLLAGCTQSPAGAGPLVSPGPLPPSLLLDRTANGTLQVFVHAKQGLTRYDFINLSVENITLLSRARAYAVDVPLDVPAAHLGVEVVEGEVTYVWAARYALNLTADGPMLTVETVDDHGAYAEPRDVALPHEKLLPRDEPEGA